MADNLALPQWASSQNQPDLTVNSATVQLSGVLSDYNSYNLTSANVVLSNSDFQSYGIFVANNANGTFHTLTVPALKRSWFIVLNTSATTLSVIRGTTTITVGHNIYMAFTTDGTANGLTQISLAGAGSSTLASDTDVSITSPANQQVLTYVTGAAKWENVALPYDIATSYSGKPTASQKITIVAARSFQLPISLTGSQAVVGTNSTATMTFTLNKNGSSIGTIAFSTGGVPTTTFASAITFVAGDILTITAPGTQDATGADIGFNFVATLQ